MSAIETESESAEETHSSTSLTQPHDLSSLQENFSQQQVSFDGFSNLLDFLFIIWVFFNEFLG